MLKTTAALLSAVLLVSCVNSSLNDFPETSPPISTLPVVVDSPLPEAIKASVRADYAAFRQIPESQVAILRFSREAWTDGCLGLGGPEESCLFALTEGWQVEASDMNGAKSSFYRTNLTGDSVRRSTLENNLPPSVGDRILQTLRASGAAQTDELSIVSAAPRLWDGCYGIATEGDVCAEIAIFGWQAIATDTQRYWAYHTDGPGNTIVLNGDIDGTDTPEASEESVSEVPSETIPTALEEGDDGAPFAALEVNDFSLQALLAQVGPGCSILLRRTAENEDFILREGYGENGSAVMKIEEKWTTFLPQGNFVGINQPIRTFVSEDSELQLTLDTPAGARLGSELTKIPSATIEIISDNENTTVLSAVGEAGC